MNRCYYCHYYQEYSHVEEKALIQVYLMEEGAISRLQVEYVIVQQEPSGEYLYKSKQPYR
jgi:hypothetical protein